MRASRGKRHAGLAMLAILALISAACGEASESEDDSSAQSGEVEDDPEGDSEAEPSSEEPADDGDTAESEAVDFEGETLRIIVPYSAGGGYDAYARLFADAFEQELGVTSVVENQPGGGALIALNNLWNAEPDGLTLGVLAGVELPQLKLVETEGVYFDVQEFSWIGNILQEKYLAATAADGPYQSFEDVIQADEFRYASAGPGSIDHISGAVLEYAIGRDADLVSGYDGSSEIAVALLRDEVQGRMSSINTLAPDIEAGEVTPVVVNSTERTDRYPDVPALIEFAETDEQKAVVEAHSSVLSLGRVLAAPPGVPEPILERLRQAFNTIVEDPDFLAAAEEQGRPIDPASAEEFAQAMDGALNAPPEYIEMLENQ